MSRLRRVRKESGMLEQRAKRGLGLHAAPDATKLCPCGQHDRLPRLPREAPSLDHPLGTFCGLACRQCHSPLEPVSAIAERYARCARRCGACYYWHNGIGLERVSDIGVARLRYTGIL